MAEIEQRVEEDPNQVLNPHREEELAGAVLETAGRLHSRGIEVSPNEEPQDLVDLLTAVERFEEQVEALGGDLMVDDLRSSRPDDPRFVVPRRYTAEPLRSYIQRIEAATGRLGVSGESIEPPPS